MPTGDRGAQLASHSKVYACVRRIVDAVTRQTGVPTRWNGELYEEHDPEALGAVDADGTMSLSVLDVIEPLELAYAPLRLSDADVEAVRDAIASVVHEAAHLSTRDGDPSREDAHPPDDAAGEALDEGLIENWTRQNFAAVVQDTGMDELVPGVLDAPPKDAYPTYSAAVRALLKKLAQMSGESVGHLEERIRTTELCQRWNTIADIAIDRHLTGVMPDGDRPVIRESLANRLRENLTRAQRVEQHPRLDDAVKSQQGFHIGEQAAGDLDLELSRLQDGYRNRERLLARPTTPTPRQPANVPGEDPEVEHLRRMLSGVAPAAQATRMDPAAGTRTSFRRATVGRAVGRDRS